MSNTNNDMTSWNDFFKQAIGDVKELSWAIDLWGEALTGHSFDYLLIHILVNRGRSKRIVAHLDDSCPPKYQSSKEKIITLFKQSEESLNALIVQHSETIQNVLVDVLPVKIQALAKLLDAVKIRGQDHYQLELTENDDELRKQCKDFLMHWQDLALCLVELSDMPWKEKFHFQAFEDSFFKTEQKFKKLFPYFAAAEDTLKEIYKREYEYDFWWLQSAPEVETVEEAVLTDNELASLKTLFEDQPTLDDCEYVTRTMSYAMGELDGDQIHIAKDHVTSCHSCFDLYFNVRNADKLAQESNSESIEYPPLFAEAISKNTSKPAKHKEVIICYLSSIASFFNKLWVSPSPYVKAVTATCFVMVAFLIITIGPLNYNKSLPLTSITANLQLYAVIDENVRSGTGRTEEILLQQEDVLKSGDFFAIYFQLKESAYTYVVLADSTGKFSELYSGNVIAEEKKRIPAQGAALQLDENTGVESVYLIVAEKEIVNFTKLLSRLSGQGEIGIKEILPTAEIFSFKILHR